jgi:hypothetical protein
LALALFAGASLVGVAPSLAAEQRYQADDWIAECDGPADNGGACSITVPFWQTADDGRGSFALVVMLQTGDVGLVGTPPPMRAVLRIDKNPEAVCRGERYCIFPAAQSLALRRELDDALLILIDVFTAKSRFSFSLNPIGYRAGMAQIRAWGYPLAEN